MLKLIVTVTSAELPEILRLPEISRLVDAGRVSFQADEVVPAIRDSSTRQKGRETFEERATKCGLRVRTAPQPGPGDFIVEGQGRTVSVRLVCSESPRISLRREWEEPIDLFLAYVWVLSARTRIFLMSYKEAADILGGKALSSPSFKDDGYYTTVCSPGRQQTMESFEDRWNVLGA
jgi:hypothetical protein